jgi:MoxR-like ATPase
LTPDATRGTATLERAEDTIELGSRLAQQLSAGDVVVLSGPLGAGKTTLAKGIAAAMDVDGPVTSPSYVLARVHPARRLGAPAMMAARSAGSDVDRSSSSSVTSRCARVSRMDFAYGWPLRGATTKPSMPPCTTGSSYWLIW